MRRSYKVLAEVVRRIIAVAEPERILLFGSRASRNPGIKNGLDLPVVKRGAHRRKLAQEIYVNLVGVGQAVDIIIVTPEDIEQFRDSPALVIKPALPGGVEVVSSLPGIT